MEPGKEVSGKVTLKHVYEIAKMKHKDPALELHTLEEVCRLVIRTARSCGIEVVHDLDPKEYEQFLSERKIVESEQKKLLQEKKEAKMLRTG